MDIYIGNMRLDSGNSRPRDFSVKMTRTSQTEKIIGARKSKLFDRGNAKIWLSFKIERAHSSESEAKNFALSHPLYVESLMPDSLKIRTETPSESMFVLESGALSEISVKAEGIITVSQYEFISEGITTL